VQVGIFFALGPIVDRLTPCRAGLIDLCCLCSRRWPVSANSRAVVVCDPEIVFFATLAIYQGASGALGRVFCRAAVGQFCAANGIIGHLGCVVGIWACESSSTRPATGSLRVAAVFFSIGVVLMYWIYATGRSGAAGRVRPAADRGDSDRAAGTGVTQHPVSNHPRRRPRQMLLYSPLPVRRERWGEVSRCGHSNRK